MQRDPKKRIVWQDIKPVNKSLNVVAKKPNLLRRIKNNILSLFRLPTKKIVLIIAILICILAIAATGCYFLKPHQAKISKDKSTVAITTNNKQTVATTPILKQGTPSYSTILPNKKNIDELGGWTRVSPPESDPVFAYTDKIGDSQIIVSQQPLPNDFKSDTFSKIEQLAQGFNANEKITIGNLSVFLGTSEDGPQSVIFNKNNLLILIKSSSKIPNNKWASYINSLQ